MALYLDKTSLIPCGKAELLPYVDAQAAWLDSAHLAFNLIYIQLTTTRAEQSFGREESESSNFASGESFVSGPLVLV